jgi:hypothetical protein
MNNRPFTRILEIIWLTVGILAAIACANSLLRHDFRNGILMGFFSLIGFLMFYVRRYLRRSRNDKTP